MSHELIIKKIDNVKDDLEYENYNVNVEKCYCLGVCIVIGLA